MAVMGISSNIMKSPSPICYITFLDMTIYSDTLNRSDITPICDLNTNLHLITKFLEVSKQNRSTERCSKLKRSVDMTSSGKNGLNITTNASPKWDRTRCQEELASSVG